MNYWFEKKNPLLALRTNEKPEKGENGKKIPRDEALNVLLRQNGYKTEVIVSYKPLEQMDLPPWTAGRDGCP